jgi:hypothetical protein
MIDFSWWVQTLAIAAGLCFVVIVSGSIIYTAIAEPSASLFSKSRRLCDQMVEILLNSNDLVEVTRAGFLVQRLECGITRRMP